MEFFLDGRGLDGSAHENVAAFNNHLLRVDETLEVPLGFRSFGGNDVQHIIDGGQGEPIAIIQEDLDEMGSD